MACRRHSVLNASGERTCFRLIPPPRQARGLPCVWTSTQLGARYGKEGTQENRACRVWTRLARKHAPVMLTDEVDVFGGPVSVKVELLREFVGYAELLDGDEKGEAQVFCDRLFKAFGHAGYKEAGAVLEARVRKGANKATSFADLVWKPRVLIEMKKRGEHLRRHYQQAFDYWLHAVPNRPRYVILCNFDDVLIYDFDRQLDEPVDQLSVADLPRRYTALNFLFPENPAPVFGNDRAAVSERAATKMAALFRHLVGRRVAPVDRPVAQRFILQLVIAMFAEDIDLIPASTVANIARDCLAHRKSSAELFGALFRQMNNPRPASTGRFQGVPYFNGGLFAKVVPIELQRGELELIGFDGDDQGAATEDWSKVNPAIFGTLFEQSMGKEARHRHGRHFTSESDIQRVVRPTLVQPWSARIAAASTAQELRLLRKELSQFRVLDPACGSGNFLYVAYRELARLDLEILLRLQKEFGGKTFLTQAKVPCAITPRQFFGIDNDAFGVELAKVTLLLAKKLTNDEAAEALREVGVVAGTRGFEFDDDRTLPLDNLDENLLLNDSLFCAWPRVEAIVGNPPYQSKNKAQKELGAKYLNSLRAAFPEIDGRADYCVYWFRKAHDHLLQGQRAGLVGTNTIRQNYSRMGGLDYIVSHGGTITEAVSTMIWPGAATVHVSVVNWIKGSAKGKKRLHAQDGNVLEEGWRWEELDKIGPSLSFDYEVGQAFELAVNAESVSCFQGQTHGHDGFLVDGEMAKALLKKDLSLKSYLRPFLISDDVLGNPNGKPSRYVIDFSGLSQLQASKIQPLYSQVKQRVLPQRVKAAREEKSANEETLRQTPSARINHHHQNFLKRWWQMSYPRPELMQTLRPLTRYIACGSVTKRPIFVFVSTDISPNAALTVFPLEDDYSFGILQSDLHWRWFVARCSTLKSDPRYTSNTIFDSYPWPQHPSAAQVKAVARAAVDLRAERAQLLRQSALSMRDLYRELEGPGVNSLKQAHAALDVAVRSAYGLSSRDNALKFLFDLNAKLHAAEVRGELIQGPGLPAGKFKRADIVTRDCIRP